jgi:hypothetical protein
MSSKKGTGMGDHEMLVAAIREKKELESEYGVVAYTTIGFGDRLGVLVVRTECRKAGESLQAFPLAAFTNTWPCAQVISLPAFLFQHYCKVEIQVREATAVDRMLAATEA